MNPWYRGATRQERTRDAMRRNGLDLLLAVTPENAHYLAGHGNYIASHWRLAGLFAVALAPDGERAVVSGDFGNDPTVPLPYTHLPYTSWTESIDLRGTPAGDVRQRVEMARGTRISRPAQFWLEEVADRVAAAVRSLIGNGRRIGIDLREADAASLDRLRDRLAHWELVDATDVFDDLRAIKDPDEIAQLRLACELTEIGIMGAISRLQRGMSEVAVNCAYHLAVHQRVMEDDRFSSFRQSEGVATIGMGVESPKRVESGQTVKFDMQVDVGGYHSDIGRTVALAPSQQQRDVYEALYQALMTAERTIRPGVTFAEVFAAGAEAMAAHGFSSYSRGHLGHSDGLTQHFEEPPFIAPDESRPLAAGMVLSLELPYYLYGLGAYQLERMLLVTPDGYQTLDQLPFEFSLHLTGH